MAKCTGTKARIIRPLLDGEVGATKALQEFEQSLELEKKPGRPKGAKNRDVDLVDTMPTSCRCGSTRRAPYFNRRDLAIPGIHPQTGQEYTGIVIRRTKCLDCDQHRDDREYVNDPRR